MSLHRALVNVFAEQTSIFRQEREAARQAPVTVERQSPLQSHPPSRNPARPVPKRRTRNDTVESAADGPVQTRIQPERSARTAARTNDGEQLLKKAEPPEYPDLIMREWPSDGRTEVIITQGDFYRLEEAEYLNDTLIEFGLKHHWFSMPEETNGTSEAFTRNDIHVFNSFFYKKLSVRNKPGYKEANPDGPSWPAYETVRKWTNKVDVFSKKMLIVPINENLHWYLAVILNPGAVLKKTGANGSSAVSTEIVDLQELQAKKDELLAQQLDEEKQREEAAQKRALAKDKPREDENSVDPIDMIGGELVEDTPNDDLDDEIEDLPNQESRPTSLPEGKTRSCNQPPISIPPPSQPIALTPPPEYVPQETTKSTRRGPIVPPPPKPRTEFAPGEPVIMTFDSLGPAHAPVGKILNKWLVYEALDKVKDQTQLTENDWDAHTPAAYKRIPVPVQDNFADCGLYVVHYAIQLMKDQGELRNYLYQPLARGQEEKDRNRDMWDANEMLKKREEWKKMINDLPKSKSGAKSGEAKESPIKGNQASASSSMQVKGKEDSNLLTNATGIRNQAVIGSAASPEITYESAASLAEGVTHNPLATPRTSPAKRSISVSPIASQDAPVNKRRKIAQDHPPSHDMVAGSELDEEPMTRQGQLGVQPDVMQVDDPVETQAWRSSYLASTTPGVHTLALASPERPNDQPLEQSTVSAVTDGLRDVKVTESAVSNIQGTSGRASMGSPTTQRPGNPHATSAFVSVTTNNKSSRRETPRDRLRNDSNAEPKRTLYTHGTPAVSKTAKKNAERASIYAEPKLSREEVEREVASDFGLNGILEPLEQNPITQFRDLMVAPFRVAHEADDGESLERLKRHIEKRIPEGNGLMDTYTEQLVPGKCGLSFDSSARSLTVVTYLLNCGRCTFGQRWVGNRIGLSAIDLGNRGNQGMID